MTFAKRFETRGQFFLQRTENKSGSFFLQWDDGMVCCTAPHMFGHVNLQLTAAVQRGEKVIPPVD